MGRQLVAPETQPKPSLDDCCLTLLAAIQTMVLQWFTRQSHVSSSALLIH